MAIKDKLKAGLTNLRIAYVGVLNSIGKLQEKLKGPAGGAGAETEDISEATKPEETASEPKKKGKEGAAAGQEEQAKAETKKKGLFARLWDWFKKNILGIGTTVAASGQEATAATKSASKPAPGAADIVTQVTHDKAPEAAQQQAAKNEQTTKVHLGEDKPLTATVKHENHPDAGKPGHAFSSSNPDHYSFREASQVEGVQGKEVHLPNKARIVEAISEIDTRAYKKTADDMGLQYKHQRGADGSIHHEILTKDNKPISAEQWREFKSKSIDNFNDISKEVCKGENFSITRTPAQQPQEQRTYQSDQQAAQQIQQQQTATQQQQTTPTPKGP